MKQKTNTDWTHVVTRAPTGDKHILDDDAPTGDKQRLDAHLHTDRRHTEGEGRPDGGELVLCLEIGVRVADPHAQTPRRR